MDKVGVNIHSQMHASSSSTVSETDYSINVRISIKECMDQNNMVKKIYGMWRQCRPVVECWTTDTVFESLMCRDWTYYFHYPHNECEYWFNSGSNI